MGGFGDSKYIIIPMWTLKGRKSKSPPYGASGSGPSPRRRGPRGGSSPRCLWTPPRRASWGLGTTPGMESDPQKTPEFMPRTLYNSYNRGGGDLGGSSDSRTGRYSIYTTFVYLVPVQKIVILKMRTNFGGDNFGWSRTPGIFPYSSPLRHGIQ